MYDRNLSLPPWLISFKTVVIFMIPCSRYREEVLAREKKLLFFIPLQDESVRLSVSGSSSALLTEAIKVGAQGVISEVLLPQAGGQEMHV